MVGGISRIFNLVRVAGTRLSVVTPSLGMISSLVASVASIPPSKSPVRIAEVSPPAVAGWHSAKSTGIGLAVVLGGVVAAVAVQTTRERLRTNLRANRLWHRREVFIRDGGGRQDFLTARPTLETASMIRYLLPSAKDTPENRLTAGRIARDFLDDASKRGRRDDDGKNPMVGAWPDMRVAHREQYAKFAVELAFLPDAQDILRLKLRWSWAWLWRKWLGGEVQSLPFHVRLAFNVLLGLVRVRRLWRPRVAQ